MSTIILKNISITNILEVQDLGISLGPLQEVDLITNFTDEQILESTDIQSVLSGDGEVWLDGITQLTYTELIQFLTKLSQYDTIDFNYVSSKDTTTDVTGAELEALTDGSDVSVHIHDNRYYTKTQLETSGQASIHGDNIINSPFGSVNWKEAVDRTDSSYGSGEILPVIDNAISDCRLVKDDGDGKPAQYVCIATTGLWDEQWKKIADIDWVNAISINVVPNGGLTSTNVQSALEELQSEIAFSTAPSYVVTRKAGLIFTRDAGFVFYKEPT